jgi:hypothetical protein
MSFHRINSNPFEWFWINEKSHCSLRAGPWRPNSPQQRGPRVGPPFHCAPSPTTHPHRLSLPLGLHLCRPPGPTPSSTRHAQATGSPSPSSPWHRGPDPPSFLPLSASVCKHPMRHRSPSLTRATCSSPMRSSNSPHSSDSDLPALSTVRCSTHRDLTGPLPFPPPLPVRSTLLSATLQLEPLLMFASCPRCFRRPQSHRRMPLVADKHHRAEAPSPPPWRRITPVSSAVGHLAWQGGPVPLVLSTVTAPHLIAVTSASSRATMLVPSTVTVRWACTPRADRLGPSGHFGRWAWVSAPGLGPKSAWALFLPLLIIQNQFSDLKFLEIHLWF